MALDVAALETSLDLVTPRGAQLMDEFYTRLFAAEPSVRALFSEDLSEQKRKFLATLVLLRWSLRDLEALAPQLRGLGARHASFGARPEHYSLVSQALIDAMSALAGEAFTDHHERAWRAVLTTIAGLMLDGAAAADRTPGDLPEASAQLRS
jgi:nitric oxide dioxygenase